MMKLTLIQIAVFIQLLLISLTSCSQVQNWTHFRGSDMNGIAEGENIPLKWNDSFIKWKTEIHDRGHSSPVVYDNQVWVTTAKPDGDELYAVCLDFGTGKIIHDVRVFTPAEPDRRHPINTFATPTPCIEKDFVYVHYGSMGTACIKTSDGTIVWKNTDYKCKHVQGAASSPVLYKNMLILHFEGTDVRYIVALDKTDGSLIWKADKPSEPYEPLTVIGRKAYQTPLIMKVKGKDLLISNGSAVCVAYDPNNGKELWRVVDGAESTIAMPVTENGILYWYSGYQVDNEGKYANILAVNPDGTGDITSTNILWKKRDPLASNQMLTPLIKDGLIYSVSTRNTLFCIDAKTGTSVWSENLSSNFNSSPLYIDGNIWLFSVKGEILVIKEGRKYELVAENSMDAGIWATPAVVRNSMLLRTENTLYRISDK